MLLSSIADCELLILSLFMCGSVLYADGAFLWKLVFPSLSGSSSLLQMFCSETTSQVNGGCLSAV